LRHRQPVDVRIRPAFLDFARDEERPEIRQLDTDSGILEEAAAAILVDQQLLDLGHRQALDLDAADQAHGYRSGCIDSYSPDASSSPNTVTLSLSPSAELMAGLRLRPCRRPPQRRQHDRPCCESQELRPFRGLSRRGPPMFKSAVFSFSPL
jgi:hypothetical protein